MFNTIRSTTICPTIGSPFPGISPASDGAPLGFRRQFDGAFSQKPAYMLAALLFAFQWSKARQSIIESVSAVLLGDCHGSDRHSHVYGWRPKNIEQAQQRNVCFSLFPIAVIHTRVFLSAVLRKLTFLLVAALFAFVVRDEARAQAITPQWSCTTLNVYHPGSGAIESASACGMEAFAQAAYPLDTAGGLYGSTCGTPATAVGQSCGGGEILCNQFSQCFQGYLTFTMTATGPNASSKDAGTCQSCVDGQAGEPIVLSIGNKILKETDFLGGSESPLRFERFYNSTSVAASAPSFAQSWTHTYGASVTALSATTASVARPDGKAFTFTLSGSVWVPDADVSDKLVQLTSGTTVIGWQYINASDDSLETYDAYGNLSSIVYRNGKSVALSYVTGGGAQTFPAPLLSATDSFGNTLAFNTTSATSRTMTDPKGELYTYGLGGILQISSVTYPDTNTKTYLYNESTYTNSQNLPYALTGIMDENNSRYDSTWYGSAGGATQTALAGGVAQYTLSNTLDTNGRVQSVSLTDPLGAIRGRGFTSSVGRNRLSSVAQPAANGQPTGSKAFAFDANGNVTSSTDLNGNVQCSVFDLTRNLETGRVEGMAPGNTCPSNISTYVPASGTVERKILTQWHSVWHLPAKRAEPLKITTWVYNGDGGVLCAPASAKVGNNPIGVVCSRSEQATTDPTGGAGFSATASGSARVWRYTYNALGQVLTAKSPRTDLNDTTTYTYYTCTTGAQCGQINTITNALGQITTFNTYDGNGNPLTNTDPNGTVTTLVYDARQRLKSRQVGTETTSYSYYPTGLLKTVTRPDASMVSYTYDSAHRLTQITDGLGYYIKYTLDNAGNRMAESYYDPGNNLQRTHSRTFNAVSTLYQDINAAGTSAVTTTYGYDAQGNQTSIAAPLSRDASNAFDALNRLSQVTDPNGGITKMAYDERDNRTSVVDPRRLSTSYTFDGFDERTQLVSPDSGTTTYGYNSGGLIHTITDARGITLYYNFDALNRLIQNSLGDGTYTYQYDQGTNGLGHLTGAHDEHHTMAFTYDALGRLTGKSQSNYTVIKSVGYGYTNGDLISLVTPSGQTVTYSYTNHRITSVAVNSTTILNNVAYESFGPAATWTWGDGVARTRTFTQDGDTNTFTPGDLFTVGYDNAERISSVTDNTNSALSWSLGYDSLDRLNSASGTGTTYGWTYDANNNPLTQTGTFATTFTIAPTSNQIASTSGSLVRTYAYDADGDTTGYGSATFAYNNNGRMKSATVSSGTTNYSYNAFGQLYQKTGATTTFLFYDEVGNLLGEYASNGALIQETVWMDNLPVATLRPNGSGISIYYVDTDQLNTPRTVARTSDHKAVWTWNPDPFGTAQPNQNPNGLGTFIYNLRFPGQYYQTETGLFYNYFRDYDPQTGRYIESDPIGLAGGSYSTYAYAAGNPVSRIDPKGLQTPALCLNPANAEACAAAGEITEAQAAAIARAARVAARLAAITAAAVCMKDVDCEEWLNLLNQNFARLQYIESRGGQVEAEKLEHNEMVETFCSHCPSHCSRANTFGPRRIH